MHHGVRTKRAPRLRARLGLAHGRAGEGLAHAEVGGGERIGDVQRAHREVVRGPRPDAGERARGGDERVEVVRAVEAQRTSGDRGRERVDRGGARGRQADLRDRGRRARGD
ncbi:MAG: hypothetical protein KIT31_10810, partial [Deltaproteobacteria bacterium]|nr:hypothetical protein [Deltaproteobacteria bacterium]